MIASHIVHWAAACPLAYLVWLEIRGRSVPTTYWLLAFGFGVSFLADIVTYSTSLNWAVGHFYRPAQLALFALALGSVRISLLILTLGAIPVAVEAPEVVVTLLGSVAVVFLARDTHHAATMALYCGAGTIFYLAMSSQTDSYARFMPLWYGFQGCRLLAFSSFIRSAGRGYP